MIEITELNLIVDFSFDLVLDYKIVLQCLFFKLPPKISDTSWLREQVDQFYLD